MLYYFIDKYDIIGQVWRLDEELKLPIIYSWSEQVCDNFFMAANDKFMIVLIKKLNANLKYF